MINAMPVASGKLSRSLDVASRPPAEAPITTIGIASGGPRAINGVAETDAVSSPSREGGRGFAPADVSSVSAMVQQIASSVQVQAQLFEETAKSIARSVGMSSFRASPIQQICAIMRARRFV